VIVPFNDAKIDINTKNVVGASTQITQRLVSAISDITAVRLNFFEAE
jgi:hypothetical protein